MTTSNVITDMTTARDIVDFEQATAAARDIKYAAYIEANGVTMDTVREHVKALTTLAYPGLVPSNKVPAGTPRYKAKNFQDKVRAGLQDNLHRLNGTGKYAPTDETTDTPGKPGKPGEPGGNSDLLTKHGLETLAGLDDAALLTKVRAEIARRAK